MSAHLKDSPDPRFRFNLSVGAIKHFSSGGGKIPAPPPPPPPPDFRMMEVSLADPRPKTKFAFQAFEVESQVRVRFTSNPRFHKKKLSWFPFRRDWFKLLFVRWRLEFFWGGEVKFQGDSFARHIRGDSDLLSTHIIKDYLYNLL